MASITIDYSYITTLVQFINPTFTGTEFVNDFLEPSIDLLISPALLNKIYFDEKCLVDDSTDIAWKNFHQYISYFLLSRLVVKYAPSGVSSTSSELSASSTLSSTRYKDSLGNEIDKQYKESANSGSSLSTINGVFTKGQEYYDKEWGKILNQYTKILYYGSEDS